MPKIKNKCFICNTPTNNKYCSLKCYWKAMSQGIYPAYWTGKKRDAQTIAKCRKKLKEKYRTGEIRVWCEGKKLTKEHRNKISEAHKKIVGIKHPNWLGGRRKDERGYIRIWIAPKKWRYEHRLVMEKAIGRKLRPYEIVHHKDGNRSNNNLENLILFQNNSEHQKYHWKKIKIVKNQYGVWERKL